MNNKNLHDGFSKAVDDYIAALAELFQWDESYGYWVCDDKTGIYVHGDFYFISLSDVLYIVDHNISFEEFAEWYEYFLWACEFRQAMPSLHSWIKGCPRASKEEMEHLIKLKQDFDNAVQNCKWAF